jgi:hypothetical protein
VLEQVFYLVFSVEADRKRRRKKFSFLLHI